MRNSTAGRSCQLLLVIAGDALSRGHVAGPPRVGVVDPSHPGLSMRLDCVTPSTAVSTPETDHDALSLHAGR